MRSTVRREGERDAVYYAFTTRSEINGAPAKTKEQENV